MYISLQTYLCTQIPTNTQQLNSTQTKVRTCKLWYESVERANCADKTIEELFNLKPQSNKAKEEDIAMYVYVCKRATHQ
jgi:hypothetical protein